MQMSSISQTVEAEDTCGVSASGKGKASVSCPKGENKGNTGVTVRLSDLSTTDPATIKTSPFSRLHLKRGGGVHSSQRGSVHISEESKCLLKKRSEEKK